MRALEAKLISAKQRKPSSFLWVRFLFGIQSIEFMNQCLAFRFIKIEMFPGLLHICRFKVIYRKLKLFFEPDIAIPHDVPILGITRPDNVVNAVHILKKRCDAFQSIRQLGADRIKIDAATLLKVSKLRDLQPVEHDLPAYSRGR